MGVLHFLLLFGRTDSTAPPLSQHNGSFELHSFPFLNKPFKILLPPTQGGKHFPDPPQMQCGIPKAGQLLTAALPPLCCLLAGEQFRFADNWDKLLIIVGTVMSVVNGTTLPLLCLVFGDMTDSFIMDSTVPNISIPCKSPPTPPPPVTGL